MLGLETMLDHRTRSRCGWLAGLALVTALGVADPVFGQQTREDELAAAQMEKSLHLHPYTLTPVERALQAVENLLTNPPRLLPFVGSIFPGGLLAVGPRYRAGFAETGEVDVHAGWSLKNYKLVTAAVRSPDLANGRVCFDVHADWIDAPRVDFYGVGNDSQLSGKARFLYRAGTAGGSLKVRPMKWASGGVGLDYMNIESGGGTGGTPIQLAFAPARVPALDAKPAYARSSLFGEIDWRQSDGYTRRGGFYRLDWSDYRQTQAGPYSFRRVDAEIAQFVPLLRENWIVALHAIASTTDLDSGNIVPYFLMPALGGSTELRGYPTWRFRDRHRMLLTGEYRWTAGQFVDMALFVDAGKVAARRADLNLDDLKMSYGIGARFHSPNATALRVEIARTRDEGIGLIFAFGPVF